MADFRSGDAKPVIQAGMCTAITVIFSLIGLYMPLLALVTFFLIPIPVAYIGMMQGTKWSVLVTAGVLIIDAAMFGPISAASICAMFSCLGIAIGACWRMKLSAVQTLLAGTAVVLLSFGVQVFLLSGAAGIDFNQIQTSMSAASDKFFNEQLSSQYSGEALEQAKDQYAEVTAMAAKALPFSILVLAAFYSAVAMGLSTVIFKRLGITGIAAIPPLERWEMPKIVLYGYLVSLALKYFGGEDTIIGIVGLNAVLLCMLLCWIQGIAVLWWLPHRWPVIRPVRWLILIFGLILPLFQTAIIFAGLFDLAMSYRRRHNYN